MVVLSDAYKNSVCEIKSVHNDLLTTGRIYSINGDNVEFVHPEDDKMPLIPYNTTVKIGVFNAKQGFCMLMGTVFISTDIFLRVTNIQTLQEFERRGFFRMRVNLPSKIYVLNQEASKEGKQALSQEEQDEAMRPIMVNIEDISLSGIQVSLDQMLEIGTPFSVEVQIFKKKMMFHAKIKRMAREHNGRWFYGCAFFEQTERQIDDLCYDLFQLQRMEIKKRRT